METPEVRRYVWYTTKVSVCLYTFKAEENSAEVKKIWRKELLTFWAQKGPFHLYSEVIIHFIH